MANEELKQYLANITSPVGTAEPSESRLDNDIVRRMVEQALDPSDSMEVKITKEGEVKADMFKPEKPKGEGGEGGTKTGQPQNIGFGPALSAMTAPTGEPVSAAELRGLTPEQITAVMSGETKAEQLRQGTIGQLLDLPYRQAVTEKAMRPERPDLSLEVARISKMLTPPQQLTYRKALLEWSLRQNLSDKTIEDLKELPPSTIADMNLPASVLSAMYREDPITTASQGSYWRTPSEPGEPPSEAKWVPAGENPPEGMTDRVPTREVEIRSQLPEAKFERKKVVGASEARELIARNPRFPGNSELIHDANRDSDANTLYVWEKPGIISGGGAKKVKLPKGFTAGHFSSEMTESLQNGETIGPFKHPNTGERTMLKLVEGKVVVVE